MLTSSHAVTRTGLDAVALKPTECDVRRALELPFDTVTIDYEGCEQLPDRETLAELAAKKNLRMTIPVRADGFDPLGDDSLFGQIPESAGQVLVAGHPAYLSENEKSRAIAPRIGKALDSAPDAWVGTEGVKRIATATGATQFELLSRSTDRELRALRAAGFEEQIAVYAPTVLTDDENVILDAVGEYVARRKPVARALPEDGKTDARADGRAREVLSKASRDFALVGTEEEVGERITELKDAGADLVVGYPARGVESFLG
ncbi:hypothetical protein SAMN05421858_0730 [Haladaptatus litoreus]|uniref:Luciferase-like monooxygenase n=1 Tax=Haladaptatus litoreus TaxID=553468 RepID=A0A1N6WI47_9EURY|nr:luciferase [Haladaptatus litoreus]SIQ89670.1 hypothetical protein SAMN05421858_0730 [Haladaptatus litoreus]